MASDIQYGTIEIYWFLEWTSSLKNTLKTEALNKFNGYTK